MLERDFLWTQPASVVARPSECRRISARAPRSSKLQRLKATTHAFPNFLVALEVADLPAHLGPVECGCHLVLDFDFVDWAGAVGLANLRLAAFHRLIGEGRATVYSVFAVAVAVATSRRNAEIDSEGCQKREAHEFRVLDSVEVHATVDSVVVRPVVDLVVDFLAGVRGSRVARLQKKTLFVAVAGVFLPERGCPVRREFRFVYRIDCGIRGLFYWGYLLFQFVR